MKRFLKHIFLLTWVFLWAFSSQAVTVTIGTGTLTSNYPFTTYWMDGRTRFCTLQLKLLPEVELLVTSPVSPLM
jgi:hypothetical protein